ncbi:MAG TPA: glycosyltransferase family 39 protein [Alphaproteobacteria bacterium]|nr:glycosyltransferase family 39 protein [Alphaproteobacteria bacterium]
MNSTTDGWVHLRLAWAGLIAALLVIAATFQDYGVTWDEFYHRANGKHVLAYYASFFADRTVLTFHNLYLYGGAFDGIVALFNTVSPFGWFETSHLTNALVGLLGVVGCWKLTDCLGGPRAALIAAALLLLTPVWYGHMFFNPKDIPFASAMIWTLYYAARTAAAWPATPWRITAKLGVALGLTLGIRIGGVIALVYMAAPFAAYALADAWPRMGAAAARDLARILFRSFVPAGLIAYVVMLVCWPWAQQDPIGHPIYALQLFSNIAWNINVLFEGRLVNSMNLPADYLPVYFAVKLPETMLALLALALPIAIGATVRQLRASADARFRGFAMLAAAALLPFVYFLVQRPVTYDSIRHFLFVVPPLAAIAGLTADWILVRAERGGRPVVAGLGGLLGIGLGAQLYALVSLHPDQYVYYNALTGGVKGAENRFELDYWGNSYAEAVELLVEQLERERESGAPAISYKVAVCSSGVSASYFFPPYLEWTGNELEADFYISTTRLDCDDSLEGDPFITVERDGAVLSVVKDRRPLKAFHPERLKATGPADERVHPGAISDASMIR